MIAISLSDARIGAGIIAIIALIWLIYLLGLKRYQSRSYKQQTGSLNSQKSASKPTEALLPLHQQVEYAKASSFALSRNLLRSELLRIDELPGYEFEYYIANLLEALGFSTTVTSRSNDYGVDVIAEKSDSKYAIQVKRQGFETSS